jgi:hypothetical protein
MPYVEKYLPEYQWRGKKRYEEQMRMYEEMTKNAIEHGMTMEDIIYRNCREHVES